MVGRTFPSKRDAWLVVLLWLTAVGEGVIALVLWLAPKVPATVCAGVTALNVLVIGFVLWTLYGTDYTVEGALLVVRSGPFRWEVPLDAITSVVPSTNPLSAPALSLGRLAITYGTKEIRVSPEDRAGFVRALAEAAGGLVVDGETALRKK